MRIEALIPGAGKANDEGLRGLEPDVLARSVIDARLALRDRVPEARIAALLERVRDPDDVERLLGEARPEDRVFQVRMRNPDVEVRARWRRKLGAR